MFFDNISFWLGLILVHIVLLMRLTLISYAHSIGQNNKIGDEKEAAKQENALLSLSSSNLEHTENILEFIIITFVVLSLALPFYPS